MSGLSDATSPRGMTTFIKGKRPHARDGHSAIVHEGNMIIFGGDRHHMPYNDLFIFDLQTEFTIRQALLKWMFYFAILVFINLDELCD